MINVTWKRAATKVAKKTVKVVTKKAFGRNKVQHLNK